MGFEDELPDRLRSGVTEVQPDVTRLVAGGLERGKRMVWRRRAAQVVAAGATLAVFGGVAYAAPWNGSTAKPSGELQVAAPPPATKPSAKPETKPKLADVTPQASLQLLLDQLPADAKTSDYSGIFEGQHLPSGFLPDGTSAQLTYTDETGAKSLMSVGLSWRPNLAEEGNVPPCPEPFGAGAWYLCEYDELTVGGKLRLSQDWEYPASESTADGKAGRNGRGAKVRWVALLREDGLQITIRENNSSAEKNGPETRPTPPLTLEQMKAIALSPVWQKKLDAEYVKRAEKLFETDE